MTRDAFFAAVDRWRHKPVEDTEMGDFDDQIGDELADREEDTNHHKENKP